MSVTIYHNPRCSKSRRTLELLRERGVEPTVVEYLKDPPTVQQLAQLAERLGQAPRELLRTREQAYRDAGLDDPTLDDQELLRRMVAHPIVIERPIVVSARGAAIGRPPENVLNIL